MGAVIVGTSTGTEVFSSNTPGSEFRYPGSSILFIIYKRSPSAKNLHIEEAR